MKYLITLDLVIIFCSSIFLFSCTKKGDNTSNTQQDILMRHKWKHYQTRVITVDTATNVTVKDTLYLVEICSQNSLYVFAADSVARRTLQCFAPPDNYEGRWYLKPDSTFAAPILVRTSYGTGWVCTDFGLPYSKMKLLTETDFQLQGIYQDSFRPFKYYNTLYLNAEN